MSTHTIPVVRIDAIEPHPGADRLEVARIKGYVSIVQKGVYQAGELCVFIPPDYNVPLEGEAFAFLRERFGASGPHRVRAMRLRGVRSFGLVIPVPEGAWAEGDEVMGALGITRWEPAEVSGGSGGSWCEAGPELAELHYDLENLQSWPGVLQPGEPVIVTGKLHGQGGRFVWHAGRMYMGSRKQWRLPPGTPGEGGEVAPEHNWSRCLAQNPWIAAWCQAHPDVVLYGEVYGPQVQGGRFAYGKGPGELGFAVFDVLEGGRWVDNRALVDDPRYAGLERVEVLYRGPYDPAILAELAEQDETYNGCGHLREGVVVKPEAERVDLALGRVALKYVGVRYYERS